MKPHILLVLLTVRWEPERHMQNCRQLLEEFWLYAKVAGKDRWDDCGFRRGEITVSDYDE